MEHGASPEHPLGDVVGGVRGGRGRGGGGPRRGGGRRRRRLRRRRGGGVAGGGGGLHPQPSRRVGLGFGRLVDSDGHVLSLAGEGRTERGRSRVKLVDPAATQAISDAAEPNQTNSAKRTALGWGGVGNFFYIFNLNLKHILNLTRL